MALHVEQTNTQVNKSYTSLYTNLGLVQLTLHLSPSKDPEVSSLLGTTAVALCGCNVCKRDLTRSNLAPDACTAVKQRAEIEHAMKYTLRQ